MGIMFAFTGEGKKLIKHGKKSCRVELRIGDLEIIRTKGPNKLIVTKGGQIYEEKHAQDIIDKQFPQAHIGYVSQRLYKSFLMLTPQEKLKYIETLAFNKEYVDSLNKKCKEMIHDRKEKLVKTTKERETIEEMLDSLGIPKITTKPTTKKQKLDKMKEHLTSEKEEKHFKLTKLETNLSLKHKLEHELQELKPTEYSAQTLEQKIKELYEQNYKWGEYLKNKKKLDKLETPKYTCEEYERRIEVAKQLKSLKEEIQQLPSINNELALIDTLTEKLNSFSIVFRRDDSSIDVVIYDLERLNKFITKMDELDALPKHYLDLEMQLEKIYIPQIDSEDLCRLITITKEIKDLQKFREELEKIDEIRRTSSTKCSCPVCHADIGMWCGTLVCLEANNCYNTITHKKAEEYEKTRIHLETMIKRLVDLELEGSQIREKYKTLDLTQPKKIMKEIKDLIAKREKITNQLTSLSQKQASLNAIKEEYDIIYPYLYEIFSSYPQKDWLCVANEYKTITYKLSQKKHDQERLKQTRDQLLIKEKLYHSILTNEGELHLTALKEGLTHCRKYVALENLCDNIKCEKPTDDIDTYKELLRLKNQRAEKLALLNGIDTSDNHKQLIQELDDLQEQLTDVVSKISTIEAYTQWKKVIDVTEEEDDLKESYPRAVRLQAIITEAEKRALEETISQINFYSQMYLDRFIDNLVIELSFDKKLNMNVIHNGFESDLTSLSGGEMARVILAYTLALVELNDIDLLLLDESMASLDQDTTTTVIEAIRENFKGQVLCIAHQTMKGIYDQVVELS
jgi:DNA repair exonuclease SbcCD ATPase subunit